MVFGFYYKYLRLDCRIIYKYKIETHVIKIKRIQTKIVIQYLII